MELSLLFFLGGVSRKVKKKSPGLAPGDFFIVWFLQLILQQLCHDVLVFFLHIQVVLDAVVQQGDFHEIVHHGNLSGDECPV